MDVPYAALANQNKEANRAATRRFAEGLASVDVRVALDSRDEAREREGEDAIARNAKLLAKTEHQDWRRRRAALGWTFAQVRDDANKKHPSKIGFDSLLESEKEKDRD